MAIRELERAREGNSFGGEVKGTEASLGVGFIGVQEGDSGGCARGVRRLLNASDGAVQAGRRKGKRARRCGI